MQEVIDSRTTYVESPAYEVSARLKDEGYEITDTSGEYTNDLDSKFERNALGIVKRRSREEREF